MDLLLNGTLKGSLIILGAFAVMRLLRGHSAAARHWVLAAALAAVVVVPLLQSAVPPLKLGLVAAPAAAPGRPVARAVAGNELAFAPAPRTPQPMRWMEDYRAEPVALMGVRDIAGIVWAAGAAISLFVLAAGFARLRWLSGRAPQIVAGPWHDVTVAMTAEYGLRVPVTLLQSDHQSLLVTWGWRRPRIILPAGAASWPADRIRIVLAHELAHIRRADWAMQIAAEGLKAIYWFNPLLWIACRRLRQESEQACDDAVLACGVEGREYAWQLLQLARAFRNEPTAWLPAPAIARRSSLEQRIGAMLDPRINRRPMTRVAAAGVMTMVAIAAVLVASLSAQGRVAWIRGTVTTSNGEPVTDAVVYVTSVPPDVQLRLTTDVLGKFDSGPLSPGRYKFTSETPGIAWIDLDLAAGQQVQRDVVIAVPAMRGDITVTDRQDTRPGTHFLSEPFPNVPITPQELEDFRNWQASLPYQMPMQTRGPMPIYPEDMKAKGLDGIVNVSGRIGAEGFLIHLTADGSQAFIPAALAAMRQWEWEPARLNGARIEVPFSLTIYFDIER